MKGGEQMLKNVKKRIMPTILVIIFTLSTSVIPIEAKTKMVIPGGEAFGLKLYCKGVMVTKIESFLSNGKSLCPAVNSDIKINDIILKANNKSVKSNEELEFIVKKSKGNPIKLKIERNNEIIYKKVIPELNDKKEYHLGIWVKDSCAGIGTVSYYNPDNSTYGALGHGICDTDTGGLIPNGQGEILSADITSITKSKNNSIGTLNGYFTDKSIGDIKSNSPIGLYGSTNKFIKNKPRIKVADISEVKTGKATLLSTLSGTIPQKYDIEIIKICNTNKNSNRNFIILIKDKRLISKTGGIVQGMSGSPIIQNGKLAGALTHVFLEDCKKGYGILAENML